MIGNALTRLTWRSFFLFPVFLLSGCFLLSIHLLPSSRLSLFSFLVLCVCLIFLIALVLSFFSPFSFLSPLFFIPDGFYPLLCAARLSLFYLYLSHFLDSNFFSSRKKTRRKKVENKSKVIRAVSYHPAHWLEPSNPKSPMVLICSVSGFIRGPVLLYHRFDRTAAEYAPSPLLLVYNLLFRAPPFAPLQAIYSVTFGRVGVSAASFIYKFHGLARVKR